MRYAVPAVPFARPPTPPGPRRPHDRHDRRRQQVGGATDRGGGGARTPLPPGPPPGALSMRTCSLVDAPVERRGTARQLPARDSSGTRRRRTTPCGRGRSARDLRRGHLRIVRPIFLRKEIVGSITVESGTPPRCGHGSGGSPASSRRRCSARCRSPSACRGSPRVWSTRRWRGSIDVTRLVRDSGRYDVRAEPGGDDEIGELIDGSTRCSARFSAATSNCSCSMTTWNRPSTRAPPSCARPTRSSSGRATARWRPAAPRASSSRT